MRPFPARGSGSVRALVCLVLGGCAGGFPDVIDPNELGAAVVAPKISRLRDAGNATVPDHGAWRGESDGVLVPGELLLIEGWGFGRQPTVSVGGRAAAILARTDGGGVIVRVPVGVPVGHNVEVVVSQPRGRASLTIPVKRLAVVLHAGELRFLEVDREGARAAGAALAVPGARSVRISADGSAAYVLASGAGGDRIVTVDLAAPGAPRVSDEVKLAHRAQLLASAMDAPLLAAAGDGKVTLLAATRPTSPSAWPPSPMPKPMTAPRALELSPDGKLLVGLVAEGNRLVVADLERPPALKLASVVELLPREKLPLVRDLAFAPDGETLWVISGSHAQTFPAVLPTQLTAVRLFEAPPSGGSAPSTTAAGRHRVLSVWRTQSVPGAAAPLHVMVARGQPLASGTTIRMPPEKAAVFATAVADVMFKLADIDAGTASGAEAAGKLWRAPPPGMMVRADLSGGGGPLFTTRELMSALDLTPDAQLLIATAAQVSPAPAVNALALEFGVTVAPIWGTHQPVFLPLGRLTPAELKPPFQVGDLRIQP